MEVILLKDIPSLGKTGTIVNVSDGYARNFLIARELAIIATEGNKKRIEEIKRVEQKKIEKVLKDAESIKQALEGKTVTIFAVVGEQGKLFGSITAGDISEALKKEGIEIDKRAIELEEPIKAPGEYSISLKLSSNIHTTIKVAVEKKT